MIIKILTKCRGVLASLIGTLLESSATLFIAMLIRVKKLFLRRKVLVSSVLE
jgi:hypothetical protein